MPAPTCRPRTCSLAPQASEPLRPAAYLCWSRYRLPDVQSRSGAYAVRFGAAAMPAELPTVSYVGNVPYSAVSRCSKTLSQRPPARQQGQSFLLVTNKAVVRASPKPGRSPGEGQGSRTPTRGPSLSAQDHPNCRRNALAAQHRFDPTQSPRFVRKSCHSTCCRTRPVAGSITTNNPILFCALGKCRPIRRACSTITSS